MWMPDYEEKHFATYTIRDRMIASFWWFVLELYYLYYNNSSYSETSWYSVFYNTHPPPQKKESTKQGPVSKASIFPHPTLVYK
jgi:hypothetical protein